MKLKLISTILIFTLLATSASAASITPERYQVTEYMQNYNLHNENNSLQLACEIGQYVSEEYGWNCDIRELKFTKHAPVYINVFYPAADTKKGYEAYYGWFGPQKKEVKDFYKVDEMSNNKVMYYRDWGSTNSNWCGIQAVCSYGIVKSYFGNVAEENTTDPIIIDDPIEENTTPEPEYTEPVEVYNNTFVNTGNQTDNDITVIEASGNLSSGDNSMGTTNNQGWMEDVKQYFLDFKNANLSNVSFNFWG